MCWWAWAGEGEARGAREAAGEAAKALVGAPARAVVAVGTGVEEGKEGKTAGEGVVGRGAEEGCS